MIFRYKCIPLDRFLLSIVLHPNDDNSIELALLLLENIISKCSNSFAQRINAYCAFAPLYTNILHSKSEEFFTKLVDYYAVKNLQIYRGRLIFFYKVFK